MQRIGEKKGRRHEGERDNSGQRNEKWREKTLMKTSERWGGCQRDRDGTGQMMMMTGRSHRSLGDRRLAWGQHACVHLNKTHSRKEDIGGGHS